MRLSNQSKELVVLYNHFVRRKKWGSLKGVKEIPLRTHSERKERNAFVNYFCDIIRVFSSH